MSLSNLRRKFDWRLQHLVTWSAPIKKNIIGQAENWFRRANPTQQSRYYSLCNQYNLSDWPAICNEYEFELNLYYLDLLDQYASDFKSHSSMDIGSRSFDYLPALHAWSPHKWLGIEIDAHRRFLNMATRRGYAEWMTQHIPNSDYLCMNLLNMKDHFDFITWFLPFVDYGPLVSHGLPDEYFRPLDLLQHACSLLNPGGHMFIINQGETENRQQRELLKHIHQVRATECGELHSCFSPYKLPRFGWLVEKPV